MSCENEYHLEMSPRAKPEGGAQLVRSMGRRKKGENKCRFSERQVKQLETIFEAEMKIEPLKKVQLARELGLEPRQVAIWFQNRRARWKSKQLEKEYRMLKASYENMASQVESLVEEKQALHTKLHKLILALHDPGESENKMQSGIKADKKCVRVDHMDSGNMANGRKMDYGSQEAIHGYPRVDELEDNSQASTEQELSAIDVIHEFDRACNEAQWWDFWIP